MNLKLNVSNQWLDFTYCGDTDAIAACNDAYQIGYQAETLTKTITDALLADYTLAGNTGQFMTNDRRKEILLSNKRKITSQLLPLIKPLLKDHCIKCLQNCLQKHLEFLLLII